jgi:toxin ParE1/3/4
MKLAVVYRQAARRDIVDVFRWYENQRPGLGASFVAEIARIEGHISEAPGLYQVVYGEIRRAVMRRYPCGLFYIEEKDRLVVLACLDLRRSPQAVTRILGRR